MDATRELERQQMLTEEPHKTCALETCMVQELGGFATAMAWLPTYDKNGRLVSEDPNTHSFDKQCVTCGARWSTWRRGKDRGVRILKPSPHSPTQPAS